MADDKPSYAWMGFNNWVNYAFLGMGAALTVLFQDTMGLVPLAFFGAAEAFWLLIGARVGGPRRYFNFLHDEQRRLLAAGREQELVRTLGEHDRQRFLELDRLRQEIRQQVESNPSMTMDLVKGELEKVDRLLDTFLHLASTAARYEQYVDASDLNQLEAELRRQEKVLERAEGEARELAQRNLQVLQKRMERAIDIRKQVRHARGQLNLIENTFRLMRDQILTMDSPQQLQAQLDDLTSAVDSIEAADRETEAIARRLDREIAALRN